MSDIVERLENLNDTLLACGNDCSDILLGAVNELIQLRQQLAESQGMIEKLRQQLATCNERYKEHHGFDWNMFACI
jgi:hypothetical protein